ncbi:Regulator of chromosome condensation/beta-lactamase-inhibitor protein II [Metarhizium album ARSEF 1941]|uniref:Regulator of chromosome condensation/beta-lactamase-inhibitor protein II n=1 Tax=Metarhizium album (strain ARSEF 1941) TaxID=1081103 RepID=A0A0B2X6Q9_METAS|nr:Regulator of chromosome condensation/beta-lactamase-inhibitor protein II [Metarhizium album ARSEF 1941]KHO01155.1 Regulator of chromosome condensation/beta-lactamase-inhibitor protein II [Metarhizium album ARSEF 1941]
MEDIFAIGSNGSGQLGIGHREDVSVPKPVHFHSAPLSSRIVKIAAGGNHTLVLGESGEIYWSGDPSSGACGISDSDLETAAFRPLRLVHSGHNDTIGTPVLIAATWEASFIVSRDDSGRRTRIFSFGTGLKGELGAGEMIIRTPTATQLQNFPPPDTEIIDLAACMGHVVAVLDNGDAYGWGNCRKSQAGAPAGVIYEPRRIAKIGFNVHRAVCTKEATGLFGAPDSGRVRILGSDKWGIVSKSPDIAPPWLDIGAGWGAVYILNKDGTLQAWGRDDHGQLPPPNLPRLKKIAIGSEHVVALSQGGDVLSWGWGEHGNCGPQVENNDVQGRWNVIASSKFIPANSRITNVGAGCATSWIGIERA